MLLIGLLASTEKMVPEGRLHMRPFQFHFKEHWRFSQSLDTLLPWTEAISAHLDWWQNPTNVMKVADLHPKTTVSNSFRRLKRRLGHSLRANLCKRSVVRQAGIPGEPFKKVLAFFILKKLFFSLFQEKPFFKLKNGMKTVFNLFFFFKLKPFFSPSSQICQ